MADEPAKDPDRIPVDFWVGVAVGASWVVGLLIAYLIAARIWSWRLALPF